MYHQVISSEPRGYPRISLHQNHYAAIISPGSSLGSVDFSSRNCLASSFSAYVDEIWNADSHPAGLSFKTTPPGSTVPRYPALTIRADGRAAFGGGPTALPSPLVSLGVYRPGVFQLPRVERYDDLLVTEPFVNGTMVYVNEMDKVLVSQGGEWHKLMTTPVAPPRRQIGEPRKDGLPTIFGPRGGAPR